MRQPARGSGGRLAAVVTAAGLLVALVVTAASRGAGAPLCSTDGACHALTRTLAFRAGLAAGVATVVMLLLAAGLLRMMVLDEARRREWE